MVIMDKKVIILFIIGVFLCLSPALYAGDVLLIDDFSRSSFSNLVSGESGGDAELPGKCKPSFVWKEGITLGSGGSSLKLDFDVSAKGSFTFYWMKLGPELPDQKVSRLIEEFQIPQDDALILTKDRSLADYFVACASHCRDRLKLSQWMIQVLLKRLSDASLSIEKCPVSPENFSKLVHLVSKKEITDRIGKVVLDEMFRTSGSPESIIAQKGYQPIQDEDVLEKILDEVMAEQAEAVSQITEGKTQPINFLIGQVMRKTKGKADPKKVNELIRKKFDR